MKTFQNILRYIIMIFSLIVLLCLVSVTISFKTTNSIDNLNILIFIWTTTILLFGILVMLGFILYIGIQILIDKKLVDE